MRPVPEDPTELHVLVATLVTRGYVDEGYARAHEEMRVHNEREGFKAIEYRHFPGVLVESGRDAAVMHAIKQGYHAILQIDADMAPFRADAMVRMLKFLFSDAPYADCVGGYCNLKPPPFLPTIDTGTGTWEPHYPGSGILEVMRTGAAFFMCNSRAFQRFGPPWFRTKITNAPLSALHDVDNYARMKLSGDNPFYDSPEWLSLLMESRKAGPGESGIGEDSGFCDRMRASGGRIFVDTDIVVGHVDKQIISSHKLKEAMDKRDEIRRLAVGVMK